ncbi:MAG: transglutaminase domain-containing protein [Actinomycetota bacterium]|nr:MAG: transglutaminase domain-containing protein [Actinomycetota bacterium]
MSPAGESAPQQRATRLLLLGCVLAGYLALAAGGLLAPGLAVVAANGSVLAAALGLGLPLEGRSLTVRKTVSFVLIAAVGLAGAVQASGLPLVSLGPAIALVLSGMLVAQGLVQQTGRDLLVGLALAAFMLVLAAGLAPGPAIAIPVVVGWVLGCATLLRIDRVRQVETADAVATTSGGAATSRQRPWGPQRLVRPLAVTAVGGLVAFLLLPQAGALQWRSSLLGGATPALGPAYSRDVAYYVGGALDLRVRGALPDDPVLTVPADSPRLWQGLVLSTYAGGAWTVGADSAPTLARTAPQTYTVGSRPGRSQLDAGSGQTEAERNDQAEPQAAFAGLLVAPGQVRQVRTADRLVAMDGDGLQLQPDRGTAAPYEVRSIPVRAVSSVTGPTSGPDPAAATWTELPASVTTRTRTLGRELVAAAPDRVAAVAAVETYLRDHATYALDSPLPRPGVDPVDDFLFNSRSGFCEHFAAAEVILLRSAGIPARLVTGFAGGEPGPAGTRTFLASDAHAWVQVFVPGHGWLSSDPTAGATLATTGSWWTPATDLLLRTFGSAGGRIALAALLLGVTGLAWAVAAVLRVRRRPRVAGAGSAAEPFAAFGRLERTLDRLGTPRAGSETVAELARRLRPEPGAAEAFRVVERALYGAAPVRADAAGRAAAELDRLSDALVAAAAARHGSGAAADR